MSLLNEKKDSATQTEDKETEGVRITHEIRAHNTSAVEKGERNRDRHKNRK